MSKIYKAWNRLLANDYAFFIVISLLFAIIGHIVEYLFLNIGLVEDVSGFAYKWVSGFFFAFLLHWQRKNNLRQER